MSGLQSVHLVLRQYPITDLSSIRLAIIVYVYKDFCYTPIKTVLENAEMPRYVVTLTDDEIQELKTLVQKDGKGYRIRYA